VKRLNRLFICSLLAVCVALATLAPWVATAAEGTVSYTPESEAALTKQLDKHQVQSVVVNKRLRSLRVTLKDGTHVLVKYPKHDEPATIARLQAKGVSVTVLSTKQAEKDAHKGKSHGHKIRYIVGGVLVVVIVLVGGVLLYNRRGGRD
jgi:hypothetical protein